MKLPIFNFTSMLINNKNCNMFNSYKFNPSISHYKDDLYLLVYRNFVRYPMLRQEGLYDTNPINNPNHPWCAGQNGKRWWQSLYG